MKFKIIDVKGNAEYGIIVKRVNPQHRYLEDVTERIINSIGSLSKYRQNMKQVTSVYAFEYFEIVEEIRKLVDYLNERELIEKNDPCLYELEYM